MLGSFRVHDFFCNFYDYFEEHLVDINIGKSKKFQTQKYICEVRYRKVASSNMSRLEAHAGFFRLLMKGIFDPSDKNVIS